MALMKTKLGLFPGTDGSGKSTFLRQMKIIHDGGFTDEELADIKPDVYRCLSYLI